MSNPVSDTLTEIAAAFRTESTICSAPVGISLSKLADVLLDRAIAIDTPDVVPPSMMERLFKPAPEPTKPEPITTAATGKRVPDEKGN